MCVLHVYEMSRIGKSTEKNADWGLPGAGGRVGWEQLLNSAGFLLGDENVFGIH
jgi:hypothetical protein